MLAITSFRHCHSVFSSDVVGIYMYRYRVSLGEPCHVLEHPRIEPQVQIHGLDWASGLVLSFKDLTNFPR